MYVKRNLSICCFAIETPTVYKQLSVHFFVIDSKEDLKKQFFFQVWHYPELLYEKLAMSLSVVCEKGEMKQCVHAKLKSSVEDISRKLWNSDDPTTEVRGRGFNDDMSERRL